MPTAMMLLLLLASACVAQVAVVAAQDNIADQGYTFHYQTDRASGLVTYVSMGSTPDTTTTTTSPASKTMLGTPDSPPLFDDAGHCRYVWTDKGPVQLFQPRFPDDPALRAARSRATLDLIDAANQRALVLERWQATPELAKLRDRSDELKTVLDKITALRAVYTGP